MAISADNTLSLQCVNDQRDAQFLQPFFYSTVFCLLYVFRTNLFVHHQEHSIIYCITQYNRYNRAIRRV